MTTGEHTEQVSLKIKKIPPESRRHKWLMSIAGILVFVIGCAMPKYLDFPWYVGALTLGFGGFLVSKDLMVRYLQFIPAAIRDVYAAYKGNA